MGIRALIVAALWAALPAGAADITKVGDLELHCVATPTTELTGEAAKAYNVTPSPGRGLLTVTLMRKNRNGEAKTVPGQIYAGAINQNNLLSSIPIREVHDGDNVYYLGEYRVGAPDTLRFLVNATSMGKIFKAEFSRAFPAP